MTLIEVNKAKQRYENFNRFQLIYMIIGIVPWGNLIPSILKLFGIQVPFQVGISLITLQLIGLTLIIINFAFMLNYRKKQKQLEKE